MFHRRGFSIVELLTALTILALLLALLIPAVHAARERARETVCKNNLHQINLAIAQFAEVHKGLPKPNLPGLTGGWSVQILPYIEQHNLELSIVIGQPIASIQSSLFQPPPIFRCPRRSILDTTPDDQLSPGHYVLVPTSGRKSYSVFDAPLDSNWPWISGPEIDYDALVRTVGPHSGGFFYAQGFQQGISFMLNGQDQR